MKERKELAVIFEKKASQLTVSLYNLQLTYNVTECC